MHKNLKEIELLVLPPIKHIDEIIKDLPVKLTKAYYSSLELCIKDNKVSILHKGRDIKTFSAVWLSSYWTTRDLATTVKLYLDNFKVPNTFVEHSTSNVTVYMNFVLNGIPCPNTYYLERSKIMNHLENIENTCGYPLIMKDTKGCRSLNSAYISSREELIQKINGQKDSHNFLFQQYITNEYDWGVLVANSKVVSAERSYPKKGDYRNNAGAGATEHFVKISDIPEEIKNIALNAGNALGLSWSKSDIIVDKNTQLPYILEVNRFPSITMGSTEVDGANNFIKSYLDTVN